MLLPPPCYNYLRTARKPVVAYSSPDPCASGLRSAGRARAAVCRASAAAAAADLPWYQEDGSSGEDLMQLLHQRRPGAFPFLVQHLLRGNSSLDALSRPLPTLPLLTQCPSMAMARYVLQTWPRPAAPGASTWWAPAPETPGC